MLQQDIEQLADPNFIPDFGSSTVYVIFMIIGIMGYFTIPTVASWIVSAGGTSAYNRNVARAGSIAGNGRRGRCGKRKVTGGKYSNNHISKKQNKYMEFKSLKNIETSFRQIRLFALVFICLCALVTGFAVWNSYSFAEKQRQKIYVLDNGKSLMLALSQDMAQNRPVEAKSHVRRFHELFFTLSPDKGAIESNIKRSLFLRPTRPLSTITRTWRKRATTTG